MTSGKGDRGMQDLQTHLDSPTYTRPALQTDRLSDPSVQSHSQTLQAASIEATCHGRQTPSGNEPHQQDDVVERLSKVYKMTHNKTQDFLIQIYE